MSYQWYRHIPSAPDEAVQQEGILKRIVGAILKPWETIKHYGKALVGGTIYYYGNRVFWGGETSRYLYKRYRTVWQRMGFVRQAILAYKHRISAELPKVLSATKQVMALLDHRLKQIGVWEYYPAMIQDLLEFGDSFSEIIYSRPSFRVIGLKRIEPDYMYIQRDPYGRPILYISVIDGIPVTIEPYRMLHIKLDPQPGDAFGVGLIEGCMDDLAALRILEDLNIQLVKHNIYPHRVYVCPSNDIVTQVEATLQQQQRFGDLVVPNGVKPIQMTSGTGIDLRGFMLYYQQKVFLDMGVPMDMLIKGTGANKATAAEMQSAFNGNARAIQRQVLLKVEWLCELILASEGIVAPVKLVAPEIDKSLEFARRQEIRQLFQEGLISRDFAQELLDLNHPLNVIKVPENFSTRLNQEKNWLEQFKGGLLTRPYAIKLLGHDVPENRPSQPQQPQFQMPMPGAPAGGRGVPSGPPGVQQPTGQPSGMPAEGHSPNGDVPLGNPDDPEMIEPGAVQIVKPGGADPAQKDLPVTKPQQVGNIKIARIGLQSINMNKKSEGINMANKSVQTVYVRRTDENGNVESTPYAAIDLKSNVKRGHTQMDPRKDVPNANSNTLKDKNLKPSSKKEEQPLVPTGTNPKSGEAAPLDGDHGGIQTEPTQIPPGAEKGVQPEVGSPNEMPTDPQEDYGENPTAHPATGAPTNAQPPADGAPNGQPPQGQADGKPAGQTPQITPSPYFSPHSTSPKFADVFGDNEYSIKKPQRHVEKIREEMIDAYGQKHKRIHERTREHHKPYSEESDFIKRKKSASQRKWMNKGTGKVQQSLENVNLDDMVLVSIDLPANSAVKPWAKGLQEIVNNSLTLMSSRIQNKIRDMNKASFESNDTQQLSNLITEEILLASDNVVIMLPSIFNNIYEAGLNYANELFVSSVEKNDLSAMQKIVSDMFVDRCIVFAAEEATKTVESIKKWSMPSSALMLNLVKIFDTASLRGDNLAFSIANMVFKEAIQQVMKSPEVAPDISAIEFVVQNSETACNVCKSHNLKRTTLATFGFESCSSCNSVYRIYIVGE